MKAFKNKEGSKPSLFYPKYILRILLCMGSFLLLHIYIVNIYYDGLLVFSLESFYIFHAICALVVCGLLLIPMGGNTYVGYRFVALTFLQMVACLAFLLPPILSQPKVGEWEVLSFMFAFFVALSLEVYFAILLLNREEK